MTAVQTSLDAALAAADGMARAADHADRETPTWSDRALGCLVMWARSNPGSLWLIEDVRAYAEEAEGLPPAPDGRAWGAVAVRARRLGVIVPAGYASARSSNNSPKVLWRAA